MKKEFMRHTKEEPPWVIDQPIDLNSAVEELHGLNSQELNRLLRDSENYTLQRCTEGGSMIQIEIEKLARCLPVHLIAVLVSSGTDDNRLQYLLRGFRVLHSFCELASRHPKLEQILLEEVRITEQIMDLMFYTIIVLARYKQGNHAALNFPFLHSTLVACSFYLLTSYISSQWKDLGLVLLAHPEVDLFMDAAFNAVHIDVMFLRIKLSAAKTDVLCQSNLTAVERSAHILCQQCEASLQFLHSLCEQKLFRECLLKNKELCQNGGILSLVQAVLNLDAQHFRETSKLSASVSRMKSKGLSILLQLCEVESISYLDEIASSPRSMQVAKVVALEVLKLMKTVFGRKQQLDDCGEISFPRGLVLLNTMRLADIFSDDSNLRYFITTNTARVLAEILLLPHEEFLSSWCSEDIQEVEEDASLDYDSFTAAGAVFVLLSTGFESSNTTIMECSFNLKNLPQASYAQTKTSLLVKIIANLHCFVPNICEEQERDLFFNKFLECLRMELPKSSVGFPLNSNVQNGAIVRKNLASLLDYASCLVPTFLNEDDVHLLSKFFNELQSSATCKTEGNLAQEQDQDDKLKYSHVSDKYSNFDAGECNQETQSGGYASSSSRKMDLKGQEIPPDSRKSDYSKEGTSESLVYQDNATMIDERNEKTKAGASEPLKEVEIDLGNAETSGSEASSIRGKDSLDQLLDNGDCSKLAEHSEIKLKEVEENYKGETTNGEDKQQRKRKRNIMNDKQITLIERALLDEPEMQRNAGSLQSWADKLSVHGSELTSSQLKNWLNNRKAKLARVRGAKEIRAPSDGENSFTDKLGGLGQGHFYDSPESPSEELYVPSTTRRGSNQGTPKGDARLRTGSSETSEAVGTDFAVQQNMHINSMPMRYVRFERGQYVCLLDKEGKEIGKGKVYQVEGFWHGSCLEEVGTCVVDITELKVERKTRLQNPSETAGTTFEEAEIKIGVMRVAWDANNIIMLPL